ncbi:Ig-like domain-containing protein [Methanobrevibacter sp.]|uniref:Ig-like domain-containing protein n=1 Tax=Methanobrevibacter sp. TaxID=66852 RepID=UPI00388DF1F3
MDKNKIIILALIAIIAALLVGIVAMMPNITKQDTKLQFEGNSTLTQGDSIKIMLTDSNGSAIANQTVNVTITDKNNSSDYHSVVTDDKGIATFKLDKTSGNYKVAIAYNGNDRYNGCNASQNVAIEEKVVEAQPASTSSSSSNYDPGAFYSPQAGRVIYTGEVVDSPGGLHRHLGNNEWEPV